MFSLKSMDNFISQDDDIRNCSSRYKYCLLRGNQFTRDFSDPISKDFGQEFTDEVDASYGLKCDSSVAVVVFGIRVRKV